MEDHLLSQIPLSPKIRAAEKELVKNRPKARKSAVSASVEASEVLKKLLNTPLTLSVGEVVGLSKEVAGKLQESIDIEEARVAFVETRDKAELVNLKVTVQGNEIDAFIDSGSMLNIVSYDTWTESIKLPIDYS
ncbi:hypothetical protein JAAARDRAFT_121833, partial [Jaapia argillacea MUCL 33604]